MVMSIEELIGWGSDAACVLGLEPLERGSSAGQGQLLLVSSLGPPDRSYKVIWLVAACAGLGGTWERLHCELVTFSGPPGCLVGTVTVTTYTRLGATCWELQGETVATCTGTGSTWWELQCMPRLAIACVSFVDLSVCSAS